MQPGEAEIHDLRHALRVHDHVGRFQIPVDHPVIVQKRHAPHHATEQLQLFRQGQIRMLLQPFIQGQPSIHSMASPCRPSAVTMP